MALLPLRCSASVIILADRLLALMETSLTGREITAARHLAGPSLRQLSSRPNTEQPGQSLITTTQDGPKDYHILAKIPGPSRRLTLRNTEITLDQARHATIVTAEAALQAIRRGSEMLD
ncbi:uncharacterized protein BKA55DRAFT_692283 [Fusarium redolens]|uniref:Uncharacterized protein n=1 Tax=Fusarium redolens TaxID=48865 RepID=A0A9P9K1D3_FUSRE|nr:uncharacterized protein BKA55DRAFT_692283 [Fusarium redolens]KAH7244483.1 hypothetical protein BKA55DRAFT_692283 [Fusarium redolens]